MNDTAAPQSPSPTDSPGAVPSHGAAPQVAGVGYTVLARRFRPQTFDDVVGQQHVARALRNAITQGRVAHAYLFTGARGVGKTSMARILSKALNCPNLVDGAPCNQCEICRNIAAGQDVDISEIDGASNRGIDDIRQLRANVNVKSMRTRFKMYIIDEVHMLTKEAFNALLKTLEEPPPGVKFVFCTTEPNKVPDTILSRCQRFDFQTIETQNIIVRLQEIAEAEGYKVVPAAVELVARRAAGSMRDSQSLFDQLLAFGGETITPADVHRLLGTASDDRLIELVQALIDRRREDALQQLDDALRSGVQLGELVDQLLSYLRDLMILAAKTQSVALLAVSAENRERLAGQAQTWGLRTVLAALEILAEAKGRMFRATYARALVEMALVRLTLLQDLDQLDAVIQALKSGASLPVAASRENSAVAVGSSAQTPTTASRASPTQRPESPHAAHRLLPRGESSPPIISQREPTRRDTEADEPPRDESPTSQSQGVQTRLTRVSEPSHVIAANTVEPLRNAALTNGPGISDPGAAEKPQERIPGPTRRVSPESSVSSEVVDLREVTNLSPAQPLNPQASGLEPGTESQILAQVKLRVHDSLKTHIQAASSLAISGPNELDLIFPRSYPFSKQYCEQPAQLARLEQLVESVVGRRVKLRMRIGEDAAPPSEPKATATTVARRRIPEMIEDTFVQTAMAIFGASVVRIENLGGSSVEGTSDVQ